MATGSPKTRRRSLTPRLEKEVTALLRRHNPSKAGKTNVRALMLKFAGREAELVESIRVRL